MESENVSVGFAASSRTMAAVRVMDAVFNGFVLVQIVRCSMCGRLGRALGNDLITYPLHET